VTPFLSASEISVVSLERDWDVFLTTEFSRANGKTEMQRKDIQLLSQWQRGGVTKNIYREELGIGFERVTNSQ
jgi:hypothetical protein